MLWLRLFGVLTLVLLLFETHVLGADSLSEAILEGEGRLALRYRYEYVDQEVLEEEANASTLRVRLNYTTGGYRGWIAFAEVDSIGTLGANDFNSGGGTSPNRGQFPIVADPEGTEFNQAYLQYSGTDFNARAGRQRFNLDNQRFVGGVGWRQNEQTYDAISLRYTPSKSSEIFYAYVTNVNRIFGDDVPAGDHDNNTHLLNLFYEFSMGKLSAYYYGIDNDDVAAFSTSTFGLRFNGHTKIGEKKLSYTIESATQKDASNNPIDFNAAYFYTDAKVDLKQLAVLIGYERLQGDALTGGSAFRTPLATLHLFNGWADQFLTTPAGGLEDFFVGVSGQLQPWQYRFVWHNFETEDGSVSLGDELDLMVSRGFRKRYTATFKVARFNGEGISDISKVWFMLTAAF